MEKITEKVTKENTHTIKDEQSVPKGSGAQWDNKCICNTGTTRPSLNCYWIEHIDADHDVNGQVWKANTKRNFHYIVQSSFNDCINQAQTRSRKKLHIYMDTHISIYIYIRMSFLEYLFCSICFTLDVEVYVNIIYRCCYCIHRTLAAP